MTTNQALTELADWFFFSGGPGAPRYGDDPTKHAVDHDTETFVREVLQNANDQRLDETKPVEVQFTLRDLPGEDRDEFLSALKWEQGLQERIRTVADSERGRGYDAFLNRIDEPDGSLRVLFIEDRNTTGLTGHWKEDSNYAALVRDELYSNKQDDRAGGSYGLGKSVLWTFSGASTVLFDSYLPGTASNDPEHRRVIGRTKLPTHKLDPKGESYQGAGWLCRPAETEDGTQPKSLWNDEAAALADSLSFPRQKVPGTTIAVVDYREPTRNARPDLEELAEEFLGAAVKFFWPAIVENELKVSVDTGGEVREADAWGVPAVRPFVESFEHRSTDRQSLSAPGDIGGLNIPVSLPDRSDETETPDGSVRLVTRRSSPADDDSLLNNVALFRGAGMVVKYYDQSRIAFGDQNFHAILACGEANDVDGVTEGDREIERFLRFAEPPSHDEWESTENLRDQYKRGYRTAIETMFETARDGLRHLIVNADRGRDVLPKRVRDRFPIHGGQARKRSTGGQSPIFEIDSHSLFEEDRWSFDGVIRPTVEQFDSWTAELSMTSVGEDGARFDDIPINEVETEQPEVTVNYSDGVVTLTATPETERIDFTGESVSLAGVDVVDGKIGETQLEIRAELTTNEGD